MSTSKRQTIKTRITKFGLPILIMGLAGIVIWQLGDSAPSAERRTPKVQPRLVAIEPVTREDTRIVLTGLGTVIPSRQLILYPEVSGLVKNMREHLLPGSQIKKGETLVNIDPREYEIQLARQTAEVALADSELQKEMGQQAIARQELELIGTELSEEQKALVLRQPELNGAQAKLEQAKAALAQAQMNVDRTEIKAPFNAQVVSRTIENGSKVSTSTELMTVVAIDEFWLEVEIPVEQLQWLPFDRNLHDSSQNTLGNNSHVTITSPAWQEGSRTGHLLSFSPSLNSGSRMAKVIIAVDDPLALKPENQGKPRVLINDLVRVEIRGQQVANAVVIPDAFVRNGNQVWLFAPDETLEIRTLKPIYRDADKAIIVTGLETGENIVASTLTVAVHGMPLRLAQNEQRPSPKLAGGQQ